MKDSNVTTLPTRRRGDSAAPPTEPARRSSPAFASTSQHFDEPFADALLAQARAERDARANALITRNIENRLRADKLRRRELATARMEGFDKGEERGYRHGWYWGLGIGIAIGGSVVWLCIKAGIYMALRT